MFSRLSRFCVLATLVLLLPATSAMAEKRVALIIGNSNYAKVAKLPNPAQDASAIADMLKHAGFDVVETNLDLGNVEMRRTVRNFTAIAHGASIAVVYYAGHGIEVDGSNYLIPIDAQLTSDIDVEDETLSLDRIMRMLEPVTRLRLIILDACRDNPFIRTMSRTVASRSISRGLAKIEPPMSDTLVAFAAKAGSTAEDGKGAHSPFTTALLDNFTKPGLDVGLALRQVRDQVLTQTGGKQEPFVYGSIGGSIIALVPASAPAPAPGAKPVAPAQSSIEAAVRDYEFAERIGTRQAWDSFLATHSSNPVAKYYVDLARAARDKVIAATTLYEREQEAREKEKMAVAKRAPLVPPTEVEKPPEALSITLESLAENFLVNYMQHSQGSLPELLDYVRRTYAPEVDYYEKQLKNRQVVDDQRSYATLWPDRTFRLKPETKRIVCDKANSSCDLSGELDFRAANPAKDKVSIGVATFFLRVIFFPSGPKIVLENGKVISRRD